MLRARLSPTLPGEGTGWDAGGGRSAGIAGLGSGPRRKNPLVIILKLLAALTSAFAGNGRDSEHETEP